MSVIGIDLEQFVRDPYPTGIQRVLQQLAVNWPAAIAHAQFVVPVDDRRFALLDPAQAADLLTLPFVERSSDDLDFDTGHALRLAVAAAVDAVRRDADIPKVTLAQLVGLHDAWLLPEVSYLSSVLQRLDIFARSMPTAMIGYDALPMTEPSNYRFVPGTGANVSEYFRRLATVDAVVCISEWSRSQLIGRLRRGPALVTTVAHPGGDHLAIRPAASTTAPRPVFVRLGTMEARKRPQEILRGFLKAVAQGVDAELLFIGNPSASDEAINADVRAAIDAGAPVRWVIGASDAQVYDNVAAGDAFLSIGIEGYGIPVLEAIRLGTPCLYDGIQPAGELMEGKGAAHVDASDEDAMAQMFATWTKPGALDDLRRVLAPQDVPAWSDFAMSVARVCASLV